MAYTNGRGAVSCNAITLQQIELASEPTLQSQQDLQKAFNTANRRTILMEMQRKYGAGKLIASWFKNRVYIFKSTLGEWVRGQGHNRGAPAGTLLGVESFLVFIATCTSLTNVNCILLWAALYADDTSPLIKESNVVEFQKALDWAMNWAEENGCAFHLTGDKAPTFLAYLKSGMDYPASFDELTLGDTQIQRVDKATILGLSRTVRSLDGDTTSKLIDKYGYECEWNITKLKQIAYRLQHIKFQILPIYMKQLVSSYFCGVVRYSSSLIWARSTEAHKKTTRYFYCMALASILGITAAEALNLSCCKHTSVGANNNGYRRLVQETGLPSLEEMACRDAVTVQEQIYAIYPQWYKTGTKRQMAIAKSKDRISISGVTHANRGTLIDCIF